MAPRFLAALRLAPPLPAPLYPIQSSPSSPALLAQHRALPAAAHHSHSQTSSAALRVAVRSHSTCAPVPRPVNRLASARRPARYKTCCPAPAGPKTTSAAVQTTMATIHPTALAPRCSVVRGPVPLHLFPRATPPRCSG